MQVMGAGTLGRCSKRRVAGLYSPKSAVCMEGEPILYGGTGPAGAARAKEGMRGGDGGNRRVPRALGSRRAAGGR